MSDGNDKLSATYDIFMLIAIIVSIIPLAFKNPPSAFVYTDLITTTLFIADYLMRLITADLNCSDYFAYLEFSEHLGYFAFLRLSDTLRVLQSLLK